MNEQTNEQTLVFNKSEKEKIPTRSSHSTYQRSNRITEHSALGMQYSSPRSREKWQEVCLLWVMGTTHCHSWEPGAAGNQRCWAPAPLLTNNGGGGSSSCSRDYHLHEAPQLRRQEDRDTASARKETKPTAGLVSGVAISPVTAESEPHIADITPCCGLEILRGLMDATKNP